MQSLGKLQVVQVCTPPALWAATWRRVCGVGEVLGSPKYILV